jgi:GT2 family glycosyltransferase/SAM-dependent methyltransferase
LVSGVISVEGYADTTPGARPVETPELAIIIVTYNSEGFIGGALASIRGATARRVQIVVVDNASADDTLSVVNRFSDVTLVRSRVNLGFAKACNLAARSVDAPYLLFLNPDCVLDAGSVDVAMDRLTHDPTIGIVGARTRHEDGTVNITCCFAEPSLWSALCFATGLSSALRGVTFFNPEQIGGWDRNEDRDVEVVTGCFAMMRSDLFRGLDGFDERFAMYSEDADLSRRVRSAGLRCVHVHDAGLVHVGGASEPVRAAKLSKVFVSRRQFYEKHWSRSAARVGVALMGAGVMARYVVTSVVPTRATADWGEIWRSRDMWQAPPDPQVKGAVSLGGRAFAGHPQISPPVTLAPKPWETRARIAYRLVRHVVKSTRSRDFDYVKQGIRSLALLPGLTARDVLSKPRVECNVCGLRGHAFYPNTGPGYDDPAVTCPGCSSLDRHRTLMALLVSTTSMLEPDTRVVEVAPMRGFEEVMRAQPGIDYVSFDLERRAMERGDITAMRYSDNSVGYFMCFHVLEHLPDEPAALAEILRVLRPGGTAIFQVPIDWDAASTREYDAPDPRDVGHVRRHGRDFGDRLVSAGFKVTAVSSLDIVSPETARYFGLSAQPIFFGRKPILE